MSEHSGEMQFEYNGEAYSVRFLRDTEGKIREYWIQRSNSLRYVSGKRIPLTLNGRMAVRWEVQVSSRSKSEEKTYLLSDANASIHESNTLPETPGEIETRELFGDYTDGENYWPLRDLNTRK